MSQRQEFRLPATPTRVSRKAVLDALKAGRDVPGAQLSQDERVEIRA